MIEVKINLKTNKWQKANFFKHSIYTDTQTFIFIFLFWNLSRFWIFVIFFFWKKQNWVSIYHYRAVHRVILCTLFSLRFSPHLWLLFWLGFYICTFLKYNNGFLYFYKSLYELADIYFSITNITPGCSRFWSKGKYLSHRYQLYN